MIKEFHSYEEYEVFKNAGLHPQMINGRTVLIRDDIDFDLVDELGRTNRQRMSQGLAPLDKSGNALQLHHIGQRNDGTIAMLSSNEHNSLSLHGFKTVSEIDRDAFREIRANIWKAMARRGF